MVKKILLVTLLLSVAVFTQGKNGSIKGKVFSTEGPLSGAVVILSNTNFGAATDRDGNYKLENIPFWKFIMP